MSSKKNIALVGAGIGGIAAGIALLQAGFNVRIFEKAGELRESGAGVSLWPNGTGVLQHMGLLPAVLEHGQVGTHFHLKMRSGELLMNIRTAEADTPTVCMHRADLLRVLANAFPGDCLSLGHELAVIDCSRPEVKLRFTNGESFTCDGVIGADGVHSNLRRLLTPRRRLGPSSRTRYRGYAIFRGVTDALPAMSPEHNGETWGAGSRFGVLSIGKNKVCWYATVNSSDPKERYPKKRLQKMFSGWHDPIPELIAATDPASILTGMACDHGPIRFSDRRPVTLLGDAAHALTPNLGQGACLALEDALVLANCLSGNVSMAEGFRSYESLRFSHVLSTVLRSRWLGEIGQWENRATVFFRNAVTRLLPARLFECHSPFVEHMAALMGERRDAEAFKAGPDLFCRRSHHLPRLHGK
ncbi:MAG TPA: FAD-dependent monooxygenase [Candidatus Saccharimonadales bacterium]|nr:FAD-dependent monooxygenase [Candidatus Saccharimonadales bacterium]